MSGEKFGKSLTALCQSVTLLYDRGFALGGGGGVGF